jgi:hypothetical protein
MDGDTMTGEDTKLTPRSVAVRRVAHTAKG